MWFTDNEMVANADRSHLLLNSDEDDKIEFNGITEKNSHCERLLGVDFHKKLKFGFPHGQNM